MFCAQKGKGHTMPSITPAYIESFVHLATNTDLSYNETGKIQFHNRGRRILRLIADRLGLQPGMYDIRSNMGGIAVSGEVSLHSENLYVQFAQSCLGTDWGFMYRTCKGRKDYTGGVNHWMKWEELLSLDVAVTKFKNLR